MSADPPPRPPTRPSAVPLTGEDATLLYAEAPGTQLQIGALCFFEAAPLRDARGQVRHAELCRHVESRLDGLPRFRQRIVGVLGDVATPMWVDDDDFDIERHCRHVRLPAGADGSPVPGALHRFMDRLLAERMDIAHPLWDITTVDGVEDRVGVDGTPVEVVAVVVRAHHVMADGIALHAAATLLLDPEPLPYEAHDIQWTPIPAPGPVSLTARALRERGHRQIGLALGAAVGLLDPRRVGPNSRFAARSVAVARHGPPSLAPALDLTGSIGRRRAFAWATVPMADIVSIKRACAATVNDVVLAIAAGALRLHLEDARSFDPRARAPRALVPIGDPASAGSPSSNRFSITSVELPVAIDDPLERVRRLHADMHERAASPVRSLTPHLFSVADVVPPPVLRLLAPPLLARQPLVNLAVSNIPGSRMPLHLWESRMLGLHPFIDVVGNVALIIGVLSYRDDLGIGITVDPDVAGDPRDLLVQVRAAADELAALAR